MRAVIFVNGLIRDLAATRRHLRPDDYLIGADGGTNHCLALGRQPHAVIGDLDSLSPALVEQLVAAGVQFERYPAAKDKTDLELAIEHAAQAGADSILLLGALGGRLDQTLANLLLLARTGWTVPISIIEGEEEAQILRPGKTLVLDAPVGSTVSVLALTETVGGITYTGLHYPLVGFTLPLGSTRGVSNVVAQVPATIRIETGILLVVQQLGRPEEER
jgi:thiamine pyrophosphokinase